MPGDPEEWRPWLHIGGCCRSHEKWRCTECDHESLWPIDRAWSDLRCVRRPLA